MYRHHFPYFTHREWAVMLLPLLTSLATAVMLIIQSIDSLNGHSFSQNAGIALLIVLLVASTVIYCYRAPKIGPTSQLRDRLVNLALLAAIILAMITVVTINLFHNTFASLVFITFTIGLGFSAGSYFFINQASYQPFHYLGEIMSKDQIENFVYSIISAWYSRTNSYLFIDSGPIKHLLSEITTANRIDSREIITEALDAGRLLAMEYLDWPNLPNQYTQIYDLLDYYGKPTALYAIVKGTQTIEVNNFQTKLGHIFRALAQKVITTHSVRKLAPEAETHITHLISEGFLIQYWLICGQLDNLLKLDAADTGSWLSQPYAPPTNQGIHAIYTHIFRVVYSELRSKLPEPLGDKTQVILTTATKDAFTLGRLLADIEKGNTIPPEWASPPINDNITQLLENRPDLAISLFQQVSPLFTETEPLDPDAPQHSVPLNRLALLSIRTHWESLPCTLFSHATVSKIPQKFLLLGYILQHGIHQGRLDLLKEPIA